MSLLKTSWCLSSTILMRLGYTENYIFVKYAESCLHAFRTSNSVNYAGKCQTQYHVISFYNTDESSQRSMLITSKASLSQYIVNSRRYCKSALVQDSNLFGDLSNEKYRRIEMNKLEKIEEELADNGPLLLRPKISRNEYDNLIQFHLDRKDLDSALNVLQIVKENNVKPTLMMYKLLISGFAKQGNTRMCFKLFRKMKDHGLTPSPSIYNSLINACAEAENKDEALNHLRFMREYFNVKNINLSDIHYTTLIKAYSRHQEILSAFEMADEAVDKGVCTSNVIACLFHAAISDKEKGLKIALCLWHKMRMSQMQPTITHYNLLLRAIRDTMLGDLKIYDMLVPQSQETQIQLSETDRPDLLACPPVLNTSLIEMFEKQHSNLLNASNSKLCVPNKTVLLSQCLNYILQKNRIILFGGVEMLLLHMKSDGVLPDLKTLSILLDLLPATVESEEHFLKHLKQLEIELDIRFFNTLIKRRCCRKQYNYAIAVLDEIQSRHLTPDIYTFGTLAIGCIRHNDGIELLEQMDAIGYAPNYIILETLLNNACSYKNFNYISHLMHYLLHNQIQLSNKMLHILNKFDNMILQQLEHKNKYSFFKIDEMRTNYNKYKIKCEILKEKSKKVPLQFKNKLN